MIKLFYSNGQIVASPECEKCGWTPWEFQLEFDGVVHECFNEVSENQTTEEDNHEKAKRPPRPVQSL